MPYFDVFIAWVFVEILDLEWLDEIDSVFLLLFISIFCFLLSLNCSFVRFDWLLEASLLLLLGFVSLLSIVYIFLHLLDPHPKSVLPPHRLTRSAHSLSISLLAICFDLLIALKDNMMITGEECKSILIVFNCDGSSGSDNVCWMVCNELYSLLMMLLKVFIGPHSGVERGLVIIPGVSSYVNLCVNHFWLVKI